MSTPKPPNKCPVCGEPVKANWKICPACETRLQTLICPLCRQPVKENWKRCPECQAFLVCSTCGSRLSDGQQRCPRCNPVNGDHLVSPTRFHDAVCGLEMVFVPSGAYMMGDTLSQGIEDEKPVHMVTLDAFYIGRFPVTQKQWLDLMTENPSQFTGPGHPVEQVCWGDVLAFAGKLTAAHEGRYQFRLPTEAEWEYAARSGGLDELYAGGKDIDAVAWYEANSQGRTHPVGGKASNGLGLYDMSGNVWEWCQDTYLEDAYSRHAPNNPIIQADGADRVIRGGSWNLDAWSARCSRRFNFRADFFGPGLGFRLVMVPSDA